MNEKVAFELDSNLKDTIVNDFKNYQCENKGEYICFFAKTVDLTVTIFTNKNRNKFKAYFDGKNATDVAHRYTNIVLTQKNKNKVPTKASWLVLDDQIGSDEVGTGDFFGPICVCATFISKNDIKTLKDLGVDDSKRLNDEQIRIIGKKLINNIEYSQLSLDNEKFNELNTKNMNMNEMKAKMHNRCLYNLLKKHKTVKNILVDEFAKESLYYSYLFGEKQIVKGITFKTKGETYFPSVAASSIIARYSFLQKMDNLSKKYKMEIPFGASTKVTQFAKRFVEKYGIKELDKIVKKNFVNYKELIK